MPPPARFVDRDLNPGWRDERQPIVNVTWPESQEFCDASGARLPTEAEFEYAARGGLNAPRYGALNDIAWYANNSGDRLIDIVKVRREDPNRYGHALNDNKDTVKPVATKQPNAFELYDMLGNVFEWTADWYARYDSTPQIAPKGPATGEYRVVKGGNWNSEPRGVRASGRNWFIISLRNMGVGFRCAMD
jgi:formylglycine-generating enzyme required for sulfatase activity